MYPCRAVCGLGSAQHSTDQRAEYRCALPGFSERRWKPGGGERFYMGRLPIYGDPSPEDDIDFDKGESPERPRDSHEDGCPGAWYRCAFVDSLEKYERIILESGVIPNLLADRTHDPLVIAALQYLEAERVNARNHWNDVRDKAK